jgi:hypothetical protein
MIKGMNKDLLRAGLAAFIVLSTFGSLGSAYAATNTDRLGTLCPSCCNDVRFDWAESNDNGSTANRGGYYPVDPGDNGKDPRQAQAAGSTCTRSSMNTASTTASINKCGDSGTLTISVKNAYPGYSPTIFFGVFDGQAQPGSVVSVSITSSNPEAIKTSIDGLPTNAKIPAGQAKVGALHILVTDKALPRTTYTICGTITVRQSAPGK